MAHEPNPAPELQRLALRMSEAAAKSGQAYLSLLQLADQHHSGEAPRVAGFLASTYNGETFPFDLYKLRTVDEAIGDDMQCLDALRRGRAEPHTLVPDGDRRVRAVLESSSGASPGPRGAEREPRLQPRALAQRRPTRQPRSRPS